MRKKQKRVSAQTRKALKVCVRCGYGPEDHALVNYCGGNTTSYRHDLVCPTALYKPRRKGPAMTPAARASLLDLIERLGPVYWALNKGQGRTEFRALIDDLQKEAVRLLVENADASSRLATLEEDVARMAEAGVELKDIIATLEGERDRETELRRKAEAHVRLLQAALDEKPYADEYEDLEAKLATLEGEKGRATR